jgi:hypothetical protein
MRGLVAAKNDTHLHSVFPGTATRTWRRRVVLGTTDSIDGAAPATSGDTGSTVVIYDDDKAAAVSRTHRIVAKQTLGGLLALSAAAIAGLAALL